MNIKLVGTGGFPFFAGWGCVSPVSPVSSPSCCELTRASSFFFSLNYNISVKKYRNQFTCKHSKSNNPMMLFENNS